MRLTAEKDDLVSVVCHFADKYESGAEATLALRREATDGVRDYWTAVLPVPTSRLRYFFELRGRVGEPVFLSEQGFSDKPPRSDVLPQLAALLDVSVEALLSVSAMPPPRRRRGPKGKLLKAFEAASSLPRNQQTLVEQFVSTLLAQRKAG